MIVAGKNWEKYEVSPDASTIRLQPGIVGERVNQILRPYGRIFTPDPASKNSAMVGGIIMNNASGMNCGTHANSDRMLRSVRIVLADGTVLDTGDNASKAEFRRTHPDFIRRIEELPFPVIAAVNGYALGGGCELAMACDIRIASAKAKFGQPEVKLGIIPGFSGTYRLPKLVGQGYAKEMIYSGRVIDAAEALRIGLVNHVLPPEELMDYVLGLARDIRANAPIAVRKAKACINSCYDMDETTALAAENRAFSECFATEDQKTCMQAFLGKTAPVFRNK